MLIFVCHRKPKEKQFCFRYYSFPLCYRMIIHTNKIIFFVKRLSFNDGSQIKRRIAKKFLLFLLCGRGIFGQIIIDIFLEIPLVFRNK